MHFIRESYNAGGFPDAGEQPELVEELRKAALDEPAGWFLEALEGTE
jgi:hypothetical protein